MKFLPLLRPDLNVIDLVSLPFVFWISGVEICKLYAFPGNVGLFNGSDLAFSVHKTEENVNTRIHHLKFPKTCQPRA